MIALRPFILSVVVLLLAAFLLPAQVPQQGIIDMDGQRFAPADPREKSEWTFARMRYDLGYQYGRFGFLRWAADYPKADRQFVRGVKRLTRLDVRSTEQVVDLDTDEIYNWPWLYVEDGGGWRLSDKQAARLRDYLLRGGFLMADDSHGDYEWEVFAEGMHRIFPERDIEDLTDKDEIFHVVYDLSDRVQIPGTRYIWGGRWSYTPDSAVPKWRGIRDDKGRIMVAICHNSDVGDAWEWADSPNYPEHEASVAYRIGVNYIIYGMTH
jgi:Domain of unknown function (DUF4159)